MPHEHTHRHGGGDPRLTVGSLFAGIGGFDLAARWMGWRTAWVSEIDPYASTILAKHFPDAPNHGDITRMDGRAIEPVDILVGGFPCQDISLIGKGAGITGHRSGLWTHYARLIDEIRPSYVVAENVSALRSRGLETVLGDLTALGYDAEWHCIPAAYVGAPHRRDRIWIIAYRGGSGLEGHAGNGGAAEREAASGPIATGDLRGREDAGRWWKNEPGLARVVHGVPSYVDRVRCLGNAIVPQVAHLLFQGIAARRAA